MRHAWWAAGFAVGTGAAVAFDVVIGAYGTAAVTAAVGLGCVAVVFLVRRHEQRMRVRRAMRHRRPALDAIRRGDVEAARRHLLEASRLALGEEETRKIEERHPRPRP